MKHNGSRRRVSAALVNRGTNATGIRIASPDLSGDRVVVPLHTTAGDLHVVPVFLEALQTEGALVYFRGSLQGAVAYDQIAGCWKRVGGGSGREDTPRRLSALVFAVASTPTSTRPSRIRRLVNGDQDRSPGRPAERL